ncbi:MAG: MmcQ/YjbR family DNA-binding protein [Saprospiraceae bacterium]|nr:MmcQ/YjbR family DNA-binding protein [Saprospiraceae bacterium]
MKPESIEHRIQAFRQFALSLPETDETVHFNIVSFRVKKKIFATMNAPENRATLRFTPENQDVFTAIGKGTVFPVPNKWGAYGWTHLNLETVDWELCCDALQVAWFDTAPPKLQEKYADFFENE